MSLAFVGLLFMSREEIAMIITRHYKITPKKIIFL